MNPGLQLPSLRTRLGVSCPSTAVNPQTPQVFWACSCQPPHADHCVPPQCGSWGSCFPSLEVPEDCLVLQPSHHVGLLSIAPHSIPALLRGALIVSVAHNQKTATVPLFKVIYPEAVSHLRPRSSLNLMPEQCCVLNCVPPSLHLKS